MQHRFRAHASCHGSRHQKIGERRNGLPLALDDDFDDIRCIDLMWGVPAFNITSIRRQLEAQSFVAYTTRSESVDLSDPERDVLKVCSDSWWQSNGVRRFKRLGASDADDAIFDAQWLDHILLNVDNREQESAFYSRLFGPPSRHREDRDFFEVGRSHVGVLQTPKGQHPGLNHLAISAKAFERDDVFKRLMAAGIEARPSNEPGAVQIAPGETTRLQRPTPRQ